MSSTFVAISNPQQLTLLFYHLQLHADSLDLIGQHSATTRRAGSAAIATSGPIDVREVRTVCSQCAIGLLVATGALPAPS